MNDFEKYLNEIGVSTRRNDNTPKNPFTIMKKLCGVLNKIPRKRNPEKLEEVIGRLQTLVAFEEDEDGEYSIGTYKNYCFDK